MRPVVIVGTGGHAREVADIVQALHVQGNGGKLHGFVTDDSRQHRQTLRNLPIFGTPEWVLSHDVAVVVAIGDNAVRRALVDRLAGCVFASVVAPTALVSPSARLGAGTMIFPQTVISCDVVLGAHTIVNVGASISHDTTTSAFCNINPGARLAGSCWLEMGVSVGIGASIIQGRSIGAWSVIGAGAAVVRDIPANVTAVGVPARVIKHHSS